MISGDTRESAHARMAANGRCVPATSVTRARSRRAATAFPPAKRPLPSTSCCHAAAGVGWSGAPAGSAASAARHPSIEIAAPPITALPISVRRVSIGSPSPSVLVGIVPLRFVVRARAPYWRGHRRSKRAAVATAAGVLYSPGT
jgi:hypothetical protein